MAEHFTHFTANYCVKHSKNSKKTTRLTTSAIWSIFSDLNSLYLLTFSINLALINFDGGKHVLACF